MNAHLLVTAGADKGKTFPLTDEFNVLLGRSKDANSRLNDAAVSRVHCEIEVKGTQILLTDRDSSSGTFVNSKRVAECELKPGDQIRIGDTKLRVEAPGQAADADRTIAPRGRSAPASPPVSAAVPRRPAVVTSERLPQLKGAKLSHYELGDVIAKGHTGLIFKANDFKYDRPVAFKVLFPEIAQDEEEMKRFTRAMKTMIGLTHPNLVTLYGAGKTSGYCWLAMEYVEGESIRQVLNRTGTANQLDWRITLRIGIGVARALEFAHSKNIIHRNITPQNVLMGKTPDVIKLGDLMLAKAFEGALAKNITRAGQIVGDVRYMSPESTTGKDEVDGRADIYSLGALLYALLAGRPPFEAGTVRDTILKIRKENPVRPKKFQMALPERFEGVVLKMLAKHPDSRHQSATEMLSELEKVAKYSGMQL